ncbi:MAG: flagellar export protein FliJ [Gemmatimonadales bacterium]|nr:flagellar export protein FliJ [Gemmatimonadota bacterium]MDX2060763.1 flagellar export protein FliJ [Gemmatimonadales bacterium]
MKAFSFRLERLLRLREEAEQQQARVMSEAARTEADLDRLCDDQQNYVARIGDRVTPPAGQVTNAGVLRALHLTSAAAASQLEDAERARAEARKQADQERERLADARRDRKTLERLKEHQKAAWQGEQNRDEQKTMDEIAGRPRGMPGR